MQVTNVNDKITHAIIGQQTSHALGLAQTAEFFHVLSNALYSDKILAVIREIVCNAWDAHIDSERTDIPVKITMTSNKLTIQDFGYGLSVEDLPPIYGTYGGSTKGADQNVTGGFGLGSKAPFAYVDNFEVISCHDGIKTVYRLSFSSAKLDGLPAINPMVTVATKETGITVSLAIKPGDHHKFHTCLLSLVGHGGMNVELNGNKLGNLPYDKIEKGYIFVPKETLSGVSGPQAFIRIRYGNVTYPLEGSHDDIIGLYEQVHAHCKKLLKQDSYYHSSSSSQWTLVLLAEPDTISVTPSRESLSMSDKTIGTIKELLTNFLENVKSNYNSKIYEILDESISHSFMQKLPIPAMINRIGAEPLLKYDQKMTRPNHLSNATAITRYYLANNYPGEETFRKTDLNKRLKALIQSGLVDKKLTISFKKAMAKHNAKIKQRRGRFGRDHTFPWAYQNIFWPVLREMKDNPAVDVAKLRIYREDSNHWKNINPFRKMGSVKFTNPMDALPFIRNIVIIAHNQVDVNRVGNFPIIQHWFKDYDNSLFYSAPRDPEKSTAVVQFFKDLGMTVIDLTIRHPWEPEEVEIERAAYVAAPAAPKLKGLAMLNEIVCPSYFNFQKINDDATPRILKPEFVMKSGSKMEQSHWGDWSRKSARAMVRLFGDRTGVAINSPQVERYVRDGAKELDKYVWEYLLEEFTNNQELRAAYSCSTHRFDGLIKNYKGYQLYHNLILKDPVLRSYYALPPIPSSEVVDMLTIFDDRPSYSNDPIIQDLVKLVEKIKTHPSTEKLAKEIPNSSLVSMIDCSGIELGWKELYNKTDPNLADLGQIIKIRSLILNIIEG